MGTRAKFADQGDDPGFRERLEKQAALALAENLQKSPLVAQARISATARHAAAVEFYLSAIWAALALGILLAAARPERRISPPAV